jgi:hypothetical protein
MFFIVINISCKFNSSVICKSHSISIGFSFVILSYVLVQRHVHDIS